MSNTGGFGRQKELLWLSSNLLNKEENSKKLHGTFKFVFHLKLMLHESKFNKLRNAYSNVQPSKTGWVNLNSMCCDKLIIVCFGTNIFVCYIFIVVSLDSSCIFGIVLDKLGTMFFAKGLGKLANVY